MAPKRKYDIAATGTRFGKLTVICSASVKNKGLGVLLVCDCGEQVGPKMMCNLVGSRQQSSCRKCSRKESGQRQRISSDHLAKTRVFHFYKNSAARRGLSWNLTKNDFDNLIDQPCVYCGSQKENVHRPSKKQQQWAASFYYTGIDRKDSSLGYTKENSQPCCWVCNRAKGNLNDQDFSEWIQKIRRYQHGKK